MKKLLTPLIAALVAGNSYAILIFPVSVVRTLTVSGVAETESYSQAQSSSGLGAFNRSISGLAETTYFVAESQASQTSSILENGFLIDTLVRGTTAEPLFALLFGNYFEPPGPLEATAGSTFDLVFSVLEPVAYELSGSWERSDPNRSLFGFLLSSSSNILLSANFIDQPITGILLPDTYTFRLDTTVGARKDVFGDFQRVESHLNFRATSVPDAGSTLLLLGGAFGLLLIGRKNFP